MELHHIAYAVNSIEAAEEGFAALGYSRASGVVDDVERKVTIMFLEDEKGSLIELVAPLTADSPVSALLKKNGNTTTIYHLCFVVDSVEDGVKELQKNGFVRISGVGPAPAIDGRDVVFMFSRKTGLIELVSA